MRHFIRRQEAYALNVLYKAVRISAYKRNGVFAVLVKNLLRQTAGDSVRHQERHSVRRNFNLGIRRRNLFCHAVADTRDFSEALGMIFNHVKRFFTEPRNDCRRPFRSYTLYHSASKELHHAVRTVGAIQTHFVRLKLPAELRMRDERALARYETALTHRRKNTDYRKRFKVGFHRCNGIAVFFVSETNFSNCPFKRCHQEYYNT